MENELSNEYIESAINELEEYFGIKEPISDKKIISLIWDGKLNEAVKLIANQLDLPIDVNIIFLSNDDKQQKSNERFYSTKLGKTSQDGYESIIAQINIPDSLPIYGSSSLNNYPIDIKINQNGTENKNTLIMIIAHELSHVLLHSLNHPKKENEFYTDILTMMLGFKNIFKKGRKIKNNEIKQGILTSTTSTQTTTHGYLNDEQFKIVYDKINSILWSDNAVKKQLSDQLTKFNKLMLEYKELLFKFSDYLGYLTKNVNKINFETNIEKVKIFFQPGYIENYNLVLADYTEKQKITLDFFKKFTHYNEKFRSQSEIYTNNLKIYNIDLDKKITSLNENIKIIDKYISLKHKIKNLFVNNKK